jgi:hypothetical protein
VRLQDCVVCRQSIRWWSGSGGLKFQRCIFTDRRVIVELALAIDTGSSDLWIRTPNNLNITSQTDITINLNYGIGSASGKVVYGPAYLGDFMVPQQGQHYNF